MTLKKHNHATSVKNAIKISIGISSLVAFQCAQAQEELIQSATNVVECKALSSDKLRLACFDSATEALEKIVLASLQTPKVNANSTTPTLAKKQPNAVVATTPKKETDTKTSAEEQPTWAAGPRYTEEEVKQDVADFEATIVRITVNAKGRHKFYTDDGAIWEQTQNVRFIAPDALPAKATFNRNYTGNPSISFDVSRRTYRVKRIK